MPGRCEASYSIPTANRCLRRPMITPPRFGMFSPRSKPLSIIPSWRCRVASRQNNAKMRSSIRRRHVGAFNRNGPTWTADCTDRPRQKRADLIQHSQYSAPAPSGPHYLDPNLICDSPASQAFQSVRLRRRSSPVGGSMFEKPPRVRLPRASQRFPGTQGP